MTFKIGQIFHGRYPADAAVWCNTTGTATLKPCEGGYQIVAVPPPSQEDIMHNLEMDIQDHIVATAQARGYDDDKSLISYAGSTVTQWAAEAAIFVAWRDSVWTTTHRLMAEYHPDTDPIPTSGDVIAHLPPIAWPT